MPKRAEGNLIGYVNNIDIADSTIVADMIPTLSGGTRVVATIQNLPPNASMYIYLSFNQCAILINNSQIATNCDIRLIF